MGTQVDIELKFNKTGPRRLTLIKDCTVFKHDRRDDGTSSVVLSVVASAYGHTLTDAKVRKLRDWLNWYLDNK